MAPWGQNFLHYMDMKKFLKNLLRNRWSEFKIISQECALGDPFQKLFAKILIRRKTWPPWGEAFFTVWTSEKFFKSLLLRNHLSDFEIISHDCSLGDPFRKLSTKFWSIQKHGRHGGGEGFLHYMDMKKFLKNLLRNRWSEFKIISQECSLGDPFQKLFAKILICRKTWPP